MEPHVTHVTHHLSFGDLESYITIRYDQDPEIVAGDGDPHRDGRLQTDGRIARLVGVDRHTVFRWRRQGGLSLLQADRAAVGLGVNATAIWPHAWHADIDPDLVPDDDPPEHQRHTVSS